MRWLEDLLTDNWWAARSAVEVVDDGRVTRSLTYGELLPCAASLADVLRGHDRRAQPLHVAVIAADGPAHLTADLAGLIAGALVVSPPLPAQSSPDAPRWPGTLLDDVGVVLVDAAGRRALERHRQAAGHQGAYTLVAVEAEPPRTAVVAPALKGETDDVCKMAFVDTAPPGRLTALTGYALDALVRALRRCPPAIAAGRQNALNSMRGLAQQIEVYRILACGGTVVFPAHAAQARPRPPARQAWSPAGAGPSAAVPPDRWEPALLVDSDAAVDRLALTLGRPEASAIAGVRLARRVPQYAPLAPAA